MEPQLCEFGRSLVRPMCAKGIDRIELARLMGVSPRVIDDYFYGRRKPTAKTRAKLDAILR